MNLSGNPNSKGITITELLDIFSNENTVAILAEWRWDKTRRSYPRSESYQTKTNNDEIGYYCKTCSRQFSVDLGNIPKYSIIPLRKWVVSIYMRVTCQQGFSSKILQSDIGITQKSASFVDYKIKEASILKGGKIASAVESDDTCYNRNVESLRPHWGLLRV